MSKSDKNIYYCVGCGTTHPRGNFYTSFNPTHANGIYPFCKKYIKDKVYYNKTEVDVSIFKGLLRQMDAPFLQDLWDSALEDKREVVGTYFGRINLPQNRGLTWDFSSESNTTEYEPDRPMHKNEYAPRRLEITREIRDRWTGDYTEAQLGYLEQFYQDMHITHTIVTPQHEKALILICKLQLKMDDALEKDDMAAFAKTHGEYQKLLQSSGLRPIDKIGGAEASGMRSFSQVFEEIEKEGFIVPAPIEENQDIVDKTIQYIMNYTLKLLNQQALIEPPPDTPKIDEEG